MMGYWANLQGHTEDRNPVTKVLLPCWESERARSKCFAQGSVDFVRKMELEQRTYIPIVSLLVPPPWLFPSVSIDLHILENSHLLKGTGHVPVLVEERLQTLYQNYVSIYTDGSKDPNSGRTGYAFTIPAQLVISTSRRTSDHVEVYTVELLATALKQVEQVKLILCSDSSSVLLSIKSFSSQSRQDIGNGIYENLFSYQQLPAGYQLTGE